MPGNDPFTKLLLHFNGADASTTIIDDSDSAHSPTATGNTELDTAIKKFGSASVLIDGIIGGVVVPNHADFAFGTGDFTIDFWYYKDVGGFTILIYNQIDVAAENIINITAIQTEIHFQYTRNNVLQFSFVWSHPSIVLGQWHHVAITRSGNIFRAFLDGNQAGSDETYSGSLDDYGEDVGIGAFVHFPNLTLVQYDEFRVSKGIARWVADFTPPTSEYIKLSGGGSGVNTETSSVIAISAADGPTTITTARTPTMGMYWDVGGGPAGNQLEIKDKNGNLIWGTTTQVGKTIFQRKFDRRTILNGIDVTKIDDGTLYVYRR